MSASRTLAFLDGESHSLGMSDKDKFPSELAERFQVRLPPGLRDRIKAYAERHGRSMNTEIVRVLENEFPEPFQIGDRLNELASLMSVLAAGASDTRIDQALASIEETVEGIVSGRVSDVDLETRERVEQLWRAYRERRGEEEYEAIKDAQPTYDLEEIRAIELTGRSQKFATAPARRKDFYDMTGSEQDAYLKGWGDGRADLRFNPPSAEPPSAPFGEDEA